MFASPPGYEFAYCAVHRGRLFVVHQVGGTDDVCAFRIRDEFAQAIDEASQELGLLSPVTSRVGALTARAWPQ